MLNDFLLSFFLATPAYVAVTTAGDQPHPISRLVLRYGGFVAAVLVTLALIPALLCDGKLYSDYGTCIGGSGLADVFNSVAPGIRLILLTYVLVAPLVAIACLVMNWTVKADKSPV